MAAVYQNWLPGRREEQLAMAKNWQTVCAAKQSGWNIPNPVLSDLAGAIQAAGTALAAAQNETTRTPVATAQCKAAFEALVAVMRTVKGHYFLTPPLADPDYVSLGLKPKDTIPTPVPAPTAQAEADVAFPGVHLVQLKNIRVAAGSGQGARGDYGTRIYWGLSGAARETDKFRVSSPPATGNDLPHSLFTRRKKELFDFDGESGNTVYFYLRFENSKGEAGPFGPLLSAVIP